MPDTESRLTDAVVSTARVTVLARVREGDFTARMPLEWTGLAGKIADGVNDVIIGNQSLEAELTRVSRLVAKEGKLSQRVTLGGS
ncbi:MAG: hypothetical protein QOF21_2340, partial [Actinomycetota bacterium]